MAIKQQKIKIPINPKYSKLEKTAIAQDIIDHIVDRTLKRVDKKGKPMAGYSKEYAASLIGKKSGKHKGQSANLKLTGDMLTALGEHIKIGRKYIEIGYKKGSEENAKADGNIRGTYGKKIPIRGKKRDFLGLKPSEKRTILSDYPLNDVDKLDKMVSSNIESLLIAKKIGKGTAVKTDTQIANAILEANGIDS